MIMKIKTVLIATLLLVSQFSLVACSAEEVTSLEGFKATVEGKMWRIDEENTYEGMNKVQILTEWVLTDTPNKYKRVSYIRNVKMNKQPIFEVTKYDPSKDKRDYYTGDYDFAAIDQRTGGISIRMKVIDGKIYEYYGKKPPIVYEVSTENNPAK